MKWTTPILLSFFLLAFALPAAAGPLAEPVEPQTETAGSAGDPARALFNAGRNLWDEGKWAEAEQKFREALSKYPKSDQADRIGFYHIETLSKMGRSKEALEEMNAFLKNFPQSKWSTDVQEKWIGMTGVIPPNLAQGWGGQPWTGGGSDRAGWPNGWDAGLAQELLRALLNNDAEKAIGVMKDRLKSDPTDPAVLANLNALISARTSQAVPFLISVAKSSPSPKARATAAFWLGRVSGEKDSSAAVNALAEISSSDSDKTVRQAAVQALGPRKEPKAIDAVEKYLKDPANK